MIPLVVASERGFLAKPGACDTWQGLRVRGCGMHACRICLVRRRTSLISGSGLEWPAGVGESPVREGWWCCVVCVPE